MPFPSPVPQRTLTLAEQPSLALDDYEYASLLRTIPPEIYNAISELAWVADGIYGRDGDPVQGLIGMEIESPSSAQTLLDLRWLTDGLADKEAWVTSSLGYLALDVPDAIEDMVPLPWIADASPRMSHGPSAHLPVLPWSPRTPSVRSHPGSGSWTA